MERMRAVECQCAIAACKEPFHAPHSAGTANGWAEARTWLESLSRTSRVPEEPWRAATDEEAKDQSDASPRGEAAWRERLSP